MTVTNAENRRSEPALSLIRYQILVVEDDVLNRTLLEALLHSQPDYDVASVADAQSALAYARVRTVDAMLIDTMLPDADGFALCEQILSDAGNQNLPIVLFAANDSGTDRARAIGAGAADVIVKPFQRTELMQRLRNLLRLKSLQDQLCEVEHAMLQVSALIEARDNYTHGHAKRVATNIELLGRAASLGEEEIQLLRRAAFLKDIGKSGIPDLYLNRETSWSQREREALTEQMVIPWTKDDRIDATPRLMPIIRHCHENYDGSGYPDHLEGEQIPLGARLLSIVDGYDALVSRRPFRAAHADAAARLLLIAGSGTQWDPVFVNMFIQCLDGMAVCGSQAPKHSLLAA